MYYCLTLSILLSTLIVLILSSRPTPKSATIGQTTSAILLKLPSISHTTHHTVHNITPNIKYNTHTHPSHSTSIHRTLSASIKEVDEWGNSEKRKRASEDDDWNSAMTYLYRPYIPSKTAAAAVTQQCIVSPLVLFSIADHHMRRKDHNFRGIGALLGTRNEDGTVTRIENSFAVPHTESLSDEEEVLVDDPFFRQMMQLHLKANPKEMFIGWYATSSTLNLSSALLQNHFSTMTYPHSAVHLTLACDLEAVGDDYLSAYVHAPVGRQADSNCLFVPVGVRVVAADEERAVLDTKRYESGGGRHHRLPNDLTALSSAIQEVIGMIERVQRYIATIEDAHDTPTVRAIGRFLMDTVAGMPRLDERQLENMFNAHLQDVLMMVYLASAVRSQVDVAQRLGMAVAT